MLRVVLFQCMHVAFLCTLCVVSPCPSPVNTMIVMPLYRIGLTVKRRSQSGWARARDELQCQPCDALLVRKQATCARVCADLNNLKLCDRLSSLAGSNFTCSSVPSAKLHLCNRDQSSKALVDLGALAESSNCSHVLCPHEYLPRLLSFSVHDKERPTACHTAEARY